MPRQKKQHLKRRKDGRFACRYKDQWFYSADPDEALAMREEYKRLEKIKASEPDTVVIPVSVHTGRGMKDAQHEVMELVSKQEKRDVSAESGAGVDAGDSASENQNQFGSDFMKDRAYIDDDDDNVQYPGSEA